MKKYVSLFAVIISLGGIAEAQFANAQIRAWLKSVTNRAPQPSETKRDNGIRQASYDAGGYNGPIFVPDRGYNGYPGYANYYYQQPYPQPTRHTYVRRQTSWAQQYSAAVSSMNRPGSAAPVSRHRVNYVHTEDSLPAYPVTDELPMELPACEHDECLAAPAPECEQRVCPKCEEWPCVCHTHLGHVWIGAEFLYWRIKDASLPALLTQGDPSDALPGSVGQPGTRVLYGNETDFNDPSAGARIFFGVWLDKDHTFGIGGSAFMLAEQSDGVSVASGANGTPALFFPLYRAELGREGVFTISNPTPGGGPGPIIGQAEVKFKSLLWGGDAQLGFRFLRGKRSALTLLTGVRYMSLEEELTRQQNSTDIPNVVNVRVGEGFDTENRFYGGEFGAHFACRFCQRITLEATGKVAVGNNRQTITTTGNINVTGGGVLNPGAFPGGVLTQPTNLGVRSRDQFTVIPQAQFKIGYDVNAWLQLFLGYDFMYWPHTVRPGDQVDRFVNRTQQAGGALTGPARPVPLFNLSDFWTHGANAGLRLIF